MPDFRHGFCRQRGVLCDNPVSGCLRIPSALKVVDEMTDLYGLNDYPARESIEYGSIAVRVILIAAGSWIASKGFGWLLTKLGWDQPR